MRASLPLTLSLTLIPAVTFAAPLLLVTQSREMLLIDHAQPNTVLRSAPVTGLNAGESFKGVDSRPLTREFYVLTSQNRLFKLNELSGAVQSFGTPSFQVFGSFVGMDFGAVTDRLRVVSDSDHFQLNPSTGVQAGNDFPLNPVGRYAGLAYDRAFQGATQTTLYAIDAQTDALVRIGSINGVPDNPSTGLVTSIGPLGVDVGDDASFDITPQGLALLAAQVGGISRLYRVNLSTGAATLLGDLPSGAVVQGMTYAGLFADGHE
jgi:hypothetical protein